MRLLSGWLVRVCVGCACLAVTPAWAEVPQTWVTDKGLKVIFKAAPNLPMLDMRLVFDAGAARDGEQFGLASMTNAQFALASQLHGEQAVAEAFDQVGAQFSTSVYQDMAVVQLRTLTRPSLLNKAMAQVTELLEKPAFDAQIFEREKQRRLLALQEVKYNPSKLASQAFYQALYGNHPYAHATEGEVKSVEAIALQDLKAFYGRYYVAANGVLALVGDLSLSQAKSLAAQVDAALPQGEKAPPIALPFAHSKPIQKNIAFDSQQTQIFIGQLGMKRGDADYFPLYLANHILGGSGFGSRLMEEVREKRGLTYSVYSYFSPMRERGPFLMGTQTRNERADESIRVMRETLRDFVEKGPTQAELDAAKANVLGGFALKIDSNKEQVGYWAMIGFYDLPLTYLEDFRDQIRRVRLVDVKKAVARRLHPEALIEVRLGPQGVPQSSVTHPMASPGMHRAH